MARSDLGFIPAALVGGAVAGASGTLGGPFVAAGALVAAVVLSAALDLRVVVTLWGALLPIWSVGSVDPLYFDFARFGLAAVILVRSLRSPATRGLAGRWVVPLGLSGATVAALGATRGDDSSVTIGAVMVVSLAAAWSVARYPEHVWPLLRGYVAGVAASAAVLVAAAMGVETISPQAAPGLSRVTGLGPSAPLVSYELAFGVLVAVMLARSSHRRTALYSIAALCLVALAACGGRGGAVALTLAGLVAVRHRWLRAGHMLVLGVLLWGGVVAAARWGLTLNTLERFRVQPANADLSSGRLDLIGEAWGPIFSAPLRGYGVDTFGLRFGAAPHVAPLNFALAGGVVVGLAVTLMCVGMIEASLRSHPASPLGPLLLGACVGFAAVEPLGPFVGVEGLTILLVGLTLARSANDGGLPGRGHRVDGRARDVGDPHLHRVGR